MKARKLFMVVIPVLLGLVAMVALLQVMSVSSVYADKPPGTDPPTIDGLLDESYVFQGETTDPNTPGKIYAYTGTTYCYYALVVDRAFNDNVVGPYDGTTQDGWTQHKFSSLKTSDAAYFAGTVAGCEFNLDYLDDDGSQWCSGTCGDAFYMVPDGCTTIEAATSMYYNTQSLWGEANFTAPTAPAGQTNNWVSPPLDYNCINETGDYYEWDMIYEFRVPKPAGEDCPPLSVSDSHNSPSKEEQHDDNPNPARIGNYIWYDDDGDGYQDQDTGEEPLAGVCVYLYKQKADLTWEQVATTQTDAQGEYWFNYLDPGTYYVDPGGECLSNNLCHTLNVTAAITDPIDMGSINDPDGTDPPVCGGTGPGEGDPYVITITAGETYSMADFGYLEYYASLGDYVWHDVNMNGLQDAGESGLDGVTVNLYDGSGILTTTTSGGGYYIFEYLVPGDYQVGFVLPNDNYSFSLQDRGSNDAVDSDADPTTGKTVVTTLLAGETDLTWDAGLHLCDIGDRVWHDQNGDGEQVLVFGQDWDYEGWNVVDVYLYASSPITPTCGEDGYLAMTTTISGTSQTPDGYPDGIYGFDMSEQPLGDYWVCVDESTLPSAGEGMVWARTTGDNPQKVTYKGSDDFSIDFGYEKVADPTAVTLSSFAAKSSTGGSASGLWLGLAGLTVLAAGSLFWAKRRVG